MKTINQFRKDRSGSILIVIMFAFFGYLSIYLMLSNNVRHPSSNQPLYVIQNKIDNNIYEVNIDTLTFAQKELVNSVVIDKEDMLFNRNPNFLVWTTLILIMITIASAAFPVFIGQIAQLKNKFNLKFNHILQSILFAFAIILFLAIIQMSMKGFYAPSKIIDDFGILFNHGYVIPRIVIVTFILQLPILTVIFMVGISAGKVVFDIKSKQSVEKAVSQFAMLNQILLASLQVLAILVVFSVLTTSALQQSIKSALIIKNFDIFPKEISYVYGLFFSLFLAIIFIPTYLYLRNCQNKIKHNLQNEIETENFEIPEWYNNILSKINLGGSALDNLKLSLTVLAPLISSFLPEQLRLFS
ncbi:MAG: hypothetical protein Q8S54_10440 [Bacteroidota bacterium]|nr:hypothetical protein [Odoribacter sp.]MDP3643593.1 hypothetical protein [Bacteroidota bacterium]